MRARLLDSGLAGPPATRAMTAFDESEDQAYFKAVEEAFLRLRGAPLTLSPADWHLAQGWHAAGIPLDLVRQAMDEVFARRSERGSKGRVSGLRYVAPAVEKAWRQQRELSAPGERASAAPLDVPARLRNLAAALPEVPGAAEIAVEIAALQGPSPEVEERLAELDRALLERAWSGLSPDAKREVEGAVERTLGALAGRLVPEELERSRERLRAQLVRQRLRLPVLSLFAPEAEPPP